MDYWKHLSISSIFYLVSHVTTDKLYAEDHKKIHWENKVLKPYCFYLQDKAEVHEYLQILSVINKERASGCKTGCPSQAATETPNRTDLLSPSRSPKG